MTLEKNSQRNLELFINFIVNNAKKEREELAYYKDLSCRLIRQVDILNAQIEILNAYNCDAYNELKKRSVDIKNIQVGQCIQ
jgi:hypothetical protein